jgi:hypothetical protein
VVGAVRRVRLEAHRHPALPEHHRDDPACHRRTGDRRIRQDVQPLFLRPQNLPVAVDRHQVRVEERSCLGARPRQRGEQGRRDGREASDRGHPCRAAAGSGDRSEIEAVPAEAGWAGRSG